MKRRTRAAAGAASLMLAATSFGDTAPAETIRIQVKALAYSTADITAHRGDTIEWKNDDFVTHTATARNGQFDVKLAPNHSGQTVINGSGKIEYYCRFHPNMKGTITIEAQ